ncbi:MAG: LysR family transcriptional regulator [Endozoicomonas sp.]|uniref:LysR family transcriptional regulator n=1 Tax=Endozoicomonas sp. TaxID=1892382 RepID=UPI003D9B6E61
MKFTLRQLEVFLEAARQQNLTRAAKTLAMSQSAASSALKELEQQFNTQLFDRIGKRLQLNDMGHQIRPEAEALLEKAQQLEQKLSSKTLVGQIKLGATLSIGNYLAVNIIARMMRDKPGTHIDLEVANTATITEKVLNFDLDIGLIEGELHHHDLNVIPWCDDELVVFCAPGHSFENRTQLTDQDLLNAGWILREAGSGTRQAFDRAMHGILPNLNVVMELQHTEAIKRAVEAGLGIGCLSRITLQEAFKRGSLTPLLIPERDLSRQFYFIMHRQKYIGQGIKELIQLCRSWTAGSSVHQRSAGSRTRSAEFEGTLCTSDG